MVTNKQLFSWLAACFLSMQGAAQSNKYWIHFKDKAGTPYSIHEPGKFLTPAAIDRRTRYNLPFTFTDLPVNPAYIDQVRAVPHTVVRFASKWMNGVVVSFDNDSNAPGALVAIQALPFVDGQSKVRRYRYLAPPVDSSAIGQRVWQAEEATTFDYGGSAPQVRQLNLACLHEKGYRGQGMTIAVMDAGFQNAHIIDVFDSLRSSGRLLGGRDFVHGGTDPFVGGDHGTMVLSCMAAIKPGIAMGTAPLASYWLLRTEEGGAETISEEYNWIRGAEFADSVGADILTTSLGYTDFDDPSQNHFYEMLNGRTAPMSIAGTLAARKGMFVLNAAGNEGDKPWKYIVVPGDADSICTVGSVKIEGERSVFSSVGPTADGRIKPDLVARGEGAWVCNSAGACFPGNGTSFATPILAGAVACYWQAYRKLNCIRILTRLRNNASNNATPDNLIGWGVPDVCAVMSGNFDFNAYAGASGLTVQVLDADYTYLNVEVCDLLGKTLFKAETNGNEFDMLLKIPGLPAGVYIVKVSSPYGIKSKKILKLDL